MAAEVLAGHLENVTTATLIDDHAVRLDLDVVVLWGPDDELTPADLPWHAETARGQDFSARPYRLPSWTVGYA